jgi:hypothetical protein
VCLTLRQSNVWEVLPRLETCAVDPVWLDERVRLLDTVELNLEDSSVRSGASRRVDENANLCGVFVFVCVFVCVWVGGWVGGCRWYSTAIRRQGCVYKQAACYDGV